MHGGPDLIDSGGRPRRSRRLLVAVVAAVAVAGSGTVLALRPSDPPDPAAESTARTPSVRPAGGGADVVAVLAPDARRLAESARAMLRRAYAEARPDLLSAADPAVRASLTLDDEHNAPGHLARAELCRARHDFTGAERAAATGLRVDGTDKDLQRRFDDVQLDLGRSPDAVAALRQAAVEPGVGTSLRASRVLEVRGDINGARLAAERATERATRPQERAELEDSLGLPAAAQDYDRYRAAEQAERAHGVLPDVRSTLFLVDNGSPIEALRVAQQGLRTRPSLEMQDAYGWALSVSNRYPEALAAADRASRLGWENALFLYHRSVTEQALGRTEASLEHVNRVLQLDGHFSPLLAPLAVQAYIRGYEGTD